MGKEEKKLIIASLVLVTVLVGGGLLKKNKLAKQAQEKASMQLLGQTQASRIEINNAYGRQILRKKNSKDDPPFATYRDDEFSLAHDWYIDGDHVLYASPAAVDTLLESLSELTFVTNIEAGESRLAEYGLEAPLFTVVLGEGDNQQEIAFGSKSADGESRYVYHRQKNQVGLVGLNVDYLAERKVQGWYETSVLQVQKGKLQNVMMGINAKRSIKKTDAGWTLSFIKQGLPADELEMTQWLRAINSVRATNILPKLPSEHMLKRLRFAPFGQAQELVLQLHQHHDAYYIKRSDGPFAFEVSKEDVDAIFIRMDTLLDLGLPESINDQEQLSIEHQAETLSLQKKQQWMVQNPYQDAANPARVEGIFDLLQGIAPKKFDTARQDLSGTTFTFGEGENSKRFVIDAAAGKLQVVGPVSWIADVELPQNFAGKLAEHIENMRKRDLYPLTIDDLSRFVLSEQGKTFAMQKSVDGDWISDGDDRATVAFDVMSIVEELKIESWADPKSFVRSGDAEITLHSDDGGTYTWHLGQVEGDKQLLLHTQNNVAAWVAKDQLDQLRKKL